MKFITLVIIYFLFPLLSNAQALDSSERNNIRIYVEYKYILSNKKESKIKDIERHFNINNQIIKDINYNSKGEVKKIKEYQYNLENLLIEEKHFDEKSILTKKIIYKYKNGELYTKTTFGADEKIKSKKEYSYTFFD